MRKIDPPYSSHDPQESINMERRLTQNETNIRHILEMFAEIKVELAQVNKKLSDTGDFRVMIESLEKDIREMQDFMKKLSTVTFFAQNPKLAIFAIVGFLLIFVSDFREGIIEVVRSVVN